MVNQFLSIHRSEHIIKTFAELTFAIKFIPKTKSVYLLWLMVFDTELGAISSFYLHYIWHTLAFAILTGRDFLQRPGTYSAEAVILSNKVPGRGRKSVYHTNPVALSSHRLIFTQVSTPLFGGSVKKVVHRLALAKCKKTSFKLHPTNTF